MESHVSIYDGEVRLAVVPDWSTAKSCVDALAKDAGPGRRESAHREWFRKPGYFAYARSGFVAINTFPVRP